MTALEKVLRQIVADLTESGAKFALVGGLAVSVRDEPRFTRDIDLVVATTSDAEAEALVHLLSQRGYRPIAQLEHESTGRLAAVRLSQSGDESSLVVDLMFASSGIESEVVAEAGNVEVVPGLSVPVARTESLIALKVLARDDTTRPQNRIDLHSLLSIAGPDELEAARSALQLITQRGCNRGKNLVAELDSLLAERGDFKR